MGKLTDTKIKNFKHTNTDKLESDGDGLSILVRADGKKQWIFMYSSPIHFTTAGKKQRRKTSFNYYPTMTLKGARDRANEYRELVAKGIDAIDYYDKIESETKKKVNNSFESIAERMLLEIDKPNITPATYKKKRAIIFNDAIPYLGNKLITDVTVQDIISCVKARLTKQIHSSQTTTKKPNGIPTAQKLFRYINEVFKYSITYDLCQINPCNNIMTNIIIPNHTEKHHSKITNEIELSKLINNIYNYNGHFTTVGALKLMLHIPLRVNNIVSLKWSYIDFDAKSLTIPRAEMKTKNVNLPDYNVPLSDEVVHILKELHQYNGCREYVFHSNNNKPLHKDSPNIALQRMGYKNIQTAHGMRGVYRSIIETYSNEHNITDTIKERFLDHSEKDKSKLAYVNQASYFNQMQPLVEWWSNYIITMKDII